MPFRFVSLFMLMMLALPASAQTVEMPDQVTGGGPVPIIVHGLVSQQKVTIVAERVMSDDGQLTGYRAEAQYVADRRGRIVLASNAPVAGDYSGADASGLFWSMHPIAKLPTDVASGTVRVSVLVPGRPGATGITRFITGDQDVKSEPVDGFPGALLIRMPSKRPLPVVIALGGSEGGSSFGRTFGPWLASQGYAVLVLPYYAPDWGSEKLPGLPVDFADIPVDRLTALRQWIEARPDLDRRRIGLYGVSKGGEMAIIAASRFSWLKAVAAVVPSDVVWEGWGPNVKTDDTRSSFSWAGKPLPFVPYEGMRETIAALYRGETRTLRAPHERGRAANPARVASATIPIERYRGALLVAGGGKDETWPSAIMAENIGLTRKRIGLSTTVLTFPDAGHGLSGSGWEPENYPRMASSPMATAHAQMAVRKATLDLFRRAFW